MSQNGNDINLRHPKEESKIINLRHPEKEGGTII